MKSIYVFILLVCFNCIPNYHRPFTQNNCQYQTLYFNQEITSCSKAFLKSLPIIKSAYKNKEFDSLNAFLEMWKHTCVDYSDMNMLKMLINVILNKPIDKQFDSSFIAILRFNISNYLDSINQYYAKDFDYYYANNITTINSWIKEQFCILAAKKDTSDSNLPLLLYLGGDPSNGISKATSDTTYRQTTFSKIVKREFNQLKGIKIIVPDQYNTIEQAISACKDRDTIFLKNGIYKTSSTIGKQIFIIGENNHKTIITGKFKQPCLTIKKNFIIKNIKFVSSKMAICKLGGHGKILNCIFESNNEGVFSFLSLPEISNCIFVNNRKAITLLSARHVKESISNNIFDNNRTAINFMDRTEVKIQFNIFNKNNVDVKFSASAIAYSAKGKLVFLYSNNFFGSKKKSNIKILNEQKSLNIPPLFS